MSNLYTNKFNIVQSTIAPNPTEVKYWADLSADRNGGLIKVYDGSKWIESGISREEVDKIIENLKKESDRLSHLIDNAPEELDQLPELIAAINTKVDKVEGKGLSTNDYTTAEKTKLAGLKNYDDTAIKAEIAKKANSADVFNKTEINSKLATKVDKVTGKQLSTNDFTNELKSKLENIETKKPEELIAYGICFETTSTNASVIRTGNMDLHRTLPVHNNMKMVLLSDDGTETDFDFNVANADGSKGQVMVKAYGWYSKREVNGIEYWMVSTEEPASEYEYKPFNCYFSAFEAAVDRTNTSKPLLSSVINTTAAFRGGNNSATNDGNEKTLLGKPATNLTRANFRTYAKNRGNGWYMYDYEAHNLLLMLYTIEYASFNSQLDFNANLTADGYKQGGLGAGVTSVNDQNWNTFNNHNPFVNCGITLSLKGKTGVVEYTLPESLKENTVAKVQVPSYRGIENPFGHIWKNCDGIIFDIKKDDEGGTSNICIFNDKNDYSDTLPSDTSKYTIIGQLPRSNGYIKYAQSFSFISKEIGASATTGRCDYFYTTVSSSFLATCLVGGRSDFGSSAGLGYVDSYYGVGSVSVYCGSRLLYYKN